MGGAFVKKIGLLKAMSLVHKADKMTIEERKNLRNKRLRELISYAKNNSPYFAELYKSIEADTPLEMLPVTNKLEMMENFDNWMTDHEITRERVDNFMSDLNNIGKKMDGKYLVYTTSGSTGNPCIVLYDDTTINVSSAIGVLRSFARKSDMSEFIKRGKRNLALFADNGFYLACGSVKYNLNKMPWKKKVMKVYDVRNKTEDIVTVLNEYQPAMIGSYPSTLDLLAYEQKEGRLHVNPAIIMTGGEQLTDDVRERLTNTFNCYVQTNYSCTEGGTMACECTEKHFHINDDWVILEAVDENNHPVPFGTRSAKVLLTNLANKVCPIIRFEITDRVVIHEEKCACGSSRPWLTLEGRTDDILCFENGVRIAPLSLYVILKEIKGIQRFQLIQIDNKHLELRLIADDKYNKFIEVKESVEEFLKQNNVTAEVLLSESEPKISSISGKFKHIEALQTTVGKS